MQIVQAVLGAALLAFGRKGMGLLLGALGAMVGVALASMYMQHASTGVVIAALVIGGYWNSRGILHSESGGRSHRNTWRRIRRVCAGRVHGMAASGKSWIPVVICAVLGTHPLRTSSLKWALIVLSSVVGAYLLVGAFELSPSLAAPLVIVLAAAGIWFQASLDRPKRAAQ